MENFLEHIDRNIKICIKNQAHPMLVAFRNIKSEFIYEKEKSKLSDSEIIKKMYNKRKEAAAIYESTNIDLYKAELGESALLEPFLPPELDKNDILEFLKSLSITKEKKNFKLFQTECENHFGQKVDSKIILEYLNS